MDKQIHIISNQVPSLHPLEVFWIWLKAKILAVLIGLGIFITGFGIGMVYYWLRFG